MHAQSIWYNNVFQGKAGMFFLPIHASDLDMFVYFKPTLGV